MSRPEPVKVAALGFTRAPVCGLREQRAGWLQRRRQRSGHGDTATAALALQEALSAGLEVACGNHHP